MTTPNRGFGAHAPLTPTSPLGRCYRTGRGFDTYCRVQFELLAKSSATTAARAPAAVRRPARRAHRAVAPSTSPASSNLSGAFGHYGQVALQGVQAAVNVINSSGGLNGHKLAIKSIDDGSDPAKAVIGAKSLISSVSAKDLLYFSPGNVGVTTLAVLPVTVRPSCSPSLRRPLTNRKPVETSPTPSRPTRTRCSRRHPRWPA